MKNIFRKVMFSIVACAVMAVPMLLWLWNVSKAILGKNSPLTFAFYDCLNWLGPIFITGISILMLLVLVWFAVIWFAAIWGKK